MSAVESNCETATPCWQSTSANLPVKINMDYKILYNNYILINFIYLMTLRVCTKENKIKFSKALTVSLLLLNRQLRKPNNITKMYRIDNLIKFYT